MQRDSEQPALRGSEERYRTLFEAMGQGYALCELVRDEAGRAIDITLLEVNPAYERLMGVTAEEARGRRASHLFAEADRWWLDNCDRIVRVGKPERLEHELNGDGRSFEVWLYPQGRDQLIALFDDITEQKRAEAALRESETRYRSLFTSIDEAFCILELLTDAAGHNVDIRYVETNPAFARQSGVHTKTDGRTYRELTGGAPQPEWLELCDVVVRTGESAHREWFVATTQRWVDISASRLGDAGSRRVACVIKDITERKLAAERGAFLLRLTDALRQLSDPAAIQGEATRLLREQFDAGWCYYAEFDEDGRTAIVLKDSTRGDVPSLAGRHDLSDIPEYVALLRSGVLLNVPDFGAFEALSPRVIERYVATLGIRGFLAVPLVKEGRPLAQLVMADAIVRDWPRLAVELIHEVAERTWSAIERARAEASLRASEENYRSLFETIDEGYALCELVRDERGRPIDHRFIRLNPAFEKFLGIEPERAVGRLRSEVLPNAPRDAFEKYCKVVETGEMATLETYYPRVDRWFEVRVYPRPGDRFAVLYQDVTERRRTEDALREAARRDALRIALTDALRPLADPLEIQAVAARVIGEHFDASRVHYGEISEDGAFVVISREYTNGVSSMTGRLRLDDFGPAVVRAIRAGQTIVMADMARNEELSSDEKAVYAAAGIIAGVSVSLVKGGRLVAAFAVHQSTPRAWSREDVALIEEAAERTWAAMERAKAEAALRNSEEKYRTLFETMGQGCTDLELVRDADGRAVDLRYLELNATFERIFGVPVAQAKGRRASEVFPGLESFWHETFDRIARAGTPERIEYELRLLGRWFDAQVYPRGGDRLMVLYDETTDRKRAEAESRAAARRDAFRLALSDAVRPLTDPVEIQAAVAAVIGDHFGASRVHYGEISGDGRDCVIARDYTNGVSSMAGRYRCDDFGPSLIRALREGRTLVTHDVAQTVGLSDDERAAYARAEVAAQVVVPLVKNGRLVAVLAVHASRPRAWSRDEVTLLEEAAERTWTAVERARAEEELRNSDRQKDAFIATLSHELRNPVAAISAAGMLLASPSTPRAQASDAARVVLRQTKLVTRLLDDLLDRSRIALGRFEIKKERVLVTSVIDAALEATQPLLDAAGQRVSISVTPRALAVEADGTRLGQVIANLLTNASKYSEPGQPIAIEAFASGEQVEIRVVDQGIGIEPGKIERLFDMFAQGDDEKERTRSGMGVGLALARQILELHGGSISGESDGVGKGSRFRVLLPSLRDEPSTQAAPAQEAESPKKLRLLVIEDDRDLLAMFTNVLRVLGYDANGARGGREGLTEADRLRPDVLLVDLGMPDIDGLEVARRIRATEWGASAVLIALTGWGRPSDIARAREAGFDVHLTKPIDPDKVRETIDRASKRRVGD